MTWLTRSNLKSLESSFLFSEKVALVTGGGNGLGREYCLELGRRGATVIVNDIGGDVTGSGSNMNVAQKVAEEIQQLGGKAVSLSSSVEDTHKILNFVKGDEASLYWPYRLLVQFMLKLTFQIILARLIF